MLIIDGNSLVHRAYWASLHSGTHTLSNSVDITGTKAFISMFEKVLKRFSETEVIVVFDADGPTWRNSLYPEYKSTRKSRPDSLKTQFTYIKEYLTSFNIPYLCKAGAEGDDLIGTLCKMFPEKEKIILSGDHDLLQLVDDNTVVFLTVRGVTELDKMTLGNVYSKMGIHPHQIPDFKAIAGDKSDNIPGVFRVGEKKAQELLNEYDNIEELYAHLSDLTWNKVRENLKEDKEACFLFKKICTVNCNIDLDKKQIVEMLNQSYNLTGRKKYLAKYGL